MGFEGILSRVKEWVAGMLLAEARYGDGVCVSAQRPPPRTPRIVIAAVSLDGEGCSRAEGGLSKAEGPSKVQSGKAIGLFCVGRLSHEQLHEALDSVSFRSQAVDFLRSPV